MTIYLIRHGKTVASEKHFYCGSTDLPLSEAGRAELQKVHYDIKNVRFITSGMKRTDETLRLLFGDVSFEREPRFREMDFGVFEMLGYDHLKHRPEYQSWLAGDNESNIPPGGESGREMKARVLEALVEIKDDVCIVAHGGVIAAIMGSLFPLERKNRYQWQPAPGCGWIVDETGWRELETKSCAE